MEEYCGGVEGVKAAVTTLPDDTLTSTNGHNHPSDQAKIEVEKLFTQMKEQERIPIPTIYHKNIQAIATMLDKEEIASKMSTCEHVKTSLYNSHDFQHSQEIKLMWN